MAQATRGRLLRILLLRLSAVPADTEQLPLLRAEGSLRAPNLPVNVFGK